MSRKSEIAVESTWMRFEVIVNAPGFPNDAGDKLAASVEKAIERGAVSVTPEGTEVRVTETTE